LTNSSFSISDLVNVLKLHVVSGNDFYYINGLPALTGTVATLNGNITVTTVRSPISSEFLAYTLCQW
jgi:hypothetical protein